MIGLDVTHQTALTREKAHEWASLGTQAGDFLVTMTDYYIDFYLKNQPEIRGCGLHDPLAVAAALDPSLVTTFGFNLQVDLEGPFRGRTIGDRSRLQDFDKHTQVALGVNVPGIPRPFHDPRHRRRARVNAYALAVVSVAEASVSSADNAVLASGVIHMVCG